MSILAPENAPRRRTWVRAMKPRDPDEVHRVSTPLELLFDLCFTVAIAEASEQLRTGLGHGEVGAALLGYGIAFFAIWWAWMNFTWFASAYDVDDVPYRLCVLIQIFGVLTLSAGVPSAFEFHDARIITAGYVIMRIGLVALWVRAARGEDKGRKTALRYAVGVSLVQLGWLGALLAPPSIWLYCWGLLVVAELAVPTWAERFTPIPWHATHVAERYGLLTLIVLGESVLTSSEAVQTAVDAGGLSWNLAGIIAGGVLSLFAMWWLYFDVPVHGLLKSSREAFVWGYGHLAIFASTAVVGASIGLSIDVLEGKVHIPPTLAAAAFSLSAAIYVTGVWLLHILPLQTTQWPTVACLGAVGLLLVTIALPAPVFCGGLVLAGLIAVLLTLVIHGPPATQP